VTDSRQKSKAGSGYCLQETKNPERSIDSKAKHDNPAEYPPGNGCPETEKLDYRANLGLGEPDIKIKRGSHGG